MQFRDFFRLGLKLVDLLTHSGGRERKERHGGGEGGKCWVGGLHADGDCAEGGGGVRVRIREEGDGNGDGGKGRLRGGGSF